MLAVTSLSIAPSFVFLCLGHSQGLCGAQMLQAHSPSSQVRAGPRAASLCSPSTSLLPPDFLELGHGGPLRPITVTQEGHALIGRARVPCNNPGSSASATPRRSGTAGEPSNETGGTSGKHGSGQGKPEPPGNQRRTGECGRLCADRPPAPSTLTETGPAVPWVPRVLSPFKERRARNPALRS